MFYFIVPAISLSPKSKLTKSNHSLGFINLRKIKTVSHFLGFTALTSLAGYANASFNNDYSDSNHQSSLSQVESASVSTEGISSGATSSVTSSSQSDLHQAIKTAKEKKLAYHPSWLRLHYYDNKGRKGSHSYDSKVTNPDFFISNKGKTDPEAELFSTLKAMLNKESDNNNIFCNFPARAHWLKTELDLQVETPECATFDAWQQKLDAKRLSVVFAEEYLDNPLSAFGHTLLLIDSTASIADPIAIDKAYALNATVGGNPDDNFITYAVKSIIGGYPNDITIEPYPKKLAYYVQRDNRDVWTYPLALTNDEVQQIMRHVWETKDIEVPYYFTKDNCASEILRYIDLVRPNGNLVDQLSLAVVPSDIIRLLTEKGLIIDKIYTPADDTLEQARRNNKDLSGLPKSSINKDNKLSITHLTPVDNNPLDAHLIQRAMIGIGQQDDTRYLSLAYRGGFNDLLDRPGGYPQNFDLEGVSLELRVYKDDENNSSSKHVIHDRVELENLTLIRGRSFNPMNTAQHGGTALSSWGVDLQGKQVKDGSEENSDNHLVASGTYEKGVSFAFGETEAASGQLPPHLCYVLGAGNVQVGKGLNNGYRVGVAANLGCRYQMGHKSRLLAEVELPYWYHGDIHDTHGKDIKSYYWQPIMSLGAQYDLGKNQAIRLEGSYQFLDRIEDKDNFQLSYVKHF